MSKNTITHMSKMLRRIALLNGKIDLKGAFLILLDSLYKYGTGCASLNYKLKVVIVTHT